MHSLVTIVKNNVLYTEIGSEDRLQMLVPLTHTKCNQPCEVMDL